MEQRGGSDARCAEGDGDARLTTCVVAGDHAAPTAQQVQPKRRNRTREEEAGIKK